MAMNIRLKHPWLIAVWPGMGNVALSAGYYLLSKMQMNMLVEFSPAELFDVDHVDVMEGVIQPVQRPRSRLFVWHDPEEKRDIIVFLGEAQPQSGKFAFCHRIMELARELDVERVFTFAAMSTQMHPEHESRVFCATTEPKRLNELQHLDIHLLNEGHISGLNGVLLGAAEELNIPGVCLLGEMPHIFMQFPFPKASLAVLETFKSLSGLEIDTSELYEQAQDVEEKLGEILARVQQQLGESPETEDDFSLEFSEEPNLSSEEENKIEQLFSQAREDRSKAYELKRLLDHLDVFNEYEDRFLDLFKRPE